MKKSFLTLSMAFLLFCSNYLEAQIAVENYTSLSNAEAANALVDSLMGDGVTFSNVSFQGVRSASGYQMGYFTTATTTAADMGITRGVALCSGDTDLISHPLGGDPGAANTFSRTYTSSTTGEIRKSTASINDMDVLAEGGSWYNGCILEFDFVPDGDSVVFNYVFGSEEYADNINFTNYQCTEYNDKFGFLISGPGVSGGAGYDDDARNIARLNNGSEVGINSVNDGAVGSSATPNGPGYCSATNPDWVQGVPSPEFSGYIDGTQLNGNTILLKAAQGGLTPGATYHIKLLILDARDAAYDAIVYIEAGSFSSPQPSIVLTASPSTICDGETSELVVETNELTTPITYAWSEGTTNITAFENDTIYVSPSINTTYTVTVTDAMMQQYIESVDVIVTPLVTPTFNAVGPYCSGDAIPALPTSSTNGIDGTWSPAINNTATTLYTFTSDGGQCATNTTLTIDITSPVTPTFDAVGPFCNGDAIPALPTTSINGIDGTWSPAIDNTITTLYTFTPDGGECATTQTLTIDITQPTLPTFNAVGPYCTGDIIPDLPTTSTNGVDGSWSPAINNTATTEYTFTPDAGLCASSTTLTITVNPPGTVPSFDAVGPYCSGDAIPALPTTSTNGITGDWLPAINNTATTEYTFTPVIGQCATTTTLTITVNDPVDPTFDAVGPYCNGDVIPALPTTSNNSIDGTWSPAIDNTITTEYTFTPDGGECANSTTLIIDITQPTNPTFDAVGPYCNGDVIPALPTTSLNGVSGTWSPAIDNTITTEYTFTPDGGECASSAALTINITQPTNPTFDAVGPYCNGDVISALPTTSLNGVTGSWSPAIDNTATTEYTFTPTVGECANLITLTIAIDDPVNPVFDPYGPYCQGEPSVVLPQVSNNSVSGSWNPSNINTVNSGTSNYVFTPNPGECANLYDIDVVIDPRISPEFNDFGPYCVGATAELLPSISDNAINGSWSPAEISTSTDGTTTYTFNPDAGVCASVYTTDVIVNPNLVPSFSDYGPYCVGDVAQTLPLVSENSLNGTWSPEYIDTENIGIVTYTFTAQGVDCFELYSTDITVFDYPEVTIYIADSILFSGEETTVEVSGADSYTWVSAGLFPCDNCSSAIFTAPSEQAEDETFEFVLFSESNGCQVTDTVLITVLGDIPLMIPSGFSPNGDGNADTWIIQGLERLNNSEVQILNRWGNKVYQSTPYNNDWGGENLSGGKLPAGTYYYVFKPDRDGEDSYSGYVYINY
ncbi:MAG: gliding motility-associated C-terminal domain-containing protein [Bacteroidales bacterium]|nr:gliding motility-associated C-terminal domain-containing protein [Bacteroidales bacterium]